jgi:hypothetical protein
VQAKLYSMRKLITNDESLSGSSSRLQCLINRVTGKV